MSKRLWVLGAHDTEIDAIANLLLAAGERYTYAESSGVRCRQDNAYACDPVAGATHWVECEAPGQTRLRTIDHHRAGDKYYRAPAEQYLEASSIGQVCAVIGVDARQYRYVAAADHCLRSAYAGWCPGIDRAKLIAYRSAYLEQLTGYIRGLYFVAAGLDGMPKIKTCSTLLDLRRVDATFCDPLWLREAALLANYGYVLGPHLFVRPTGRVEYTYTCYGTDTELEAFAQWARQEFDERYKVTGVLHLNLGEGHITVLE